LEVVEMSGVLISQNTLAQYQWVHCEGFIPVPNATERVFEPTVNGFYAVILDENGCVDTSACYYVEVVGLKDRLSLTDISISPNPTAGRFTIDLKAMHKDVAIEVHDAMGRICHRNKYVNQMLIPVDLELSPGIYFVKIWVDDKMGVFTIIKQ